MMKTQRIQRNQRDQKAGKNIVTALIQGLLIAVIITAAGVIIGAWLLDKNVISDGKNQYIGIVSAIGALAMLIAGGFAASVTREKPFYASLGIGGIYILLRIAAAYFLENGWQPDLLWWGQSLLQILSAVIGGIIGRFRR